TAFCVSSSTTVRKFPAEGNVYVNWTRVDPPAASVGTTVGSGPVGKKRSCRHWTMNAGVGHVPTLSTRILIVDGTPCTASPGATENWPTRRSVHGAACAPAA